MTIITSSSAFLKDLQYSELSASEQAMVDALISVANDFIEDRICNRIFTAADYTDEISDGTGWNSLFVKNPPINSLTSVVIHDISSEDDVTTTLSSMALLYDPKTGEIQRKNGCAFPQGFRNIYVNYNGGFVTIPPAVEQIAAAFVVQFYDPTLLTDGIQKERIGDYFYDKGVNWFQQLPFNIKKMLSSYRIRTMQSNWGY